MAYQALLFVHLAAAIFWIGGMAFAYVCLRPAAGRVLEAPARLALWSAVFARFLPLAAAAVALLLASGLAMLAPVGMRAAPIGWHLMLALGVVMAGVFVVVWLVLFPRLRGHCDAGAWPAAGQVLDRIRRLVALNLALGVLVVVAAVSAR